MQSTLTLQQTDPHDAFAIEPGAEASPDPVHEVLSLLSRRRAQMAPNAPAAAPIPTVDTTFRAAAIDTVEVSGDRPAKRAWAKKAIVTFLFALCSALAASAWKYHSDTAQQLISNWMLPSAFTTSAPTATPSPVPVQAAATEQAPAQPIQPPEGAAPAVAASSADSSMARDLAAMGQQIEQLKASIEQLRDSQAQMSRDIAKNSDAKASEPNPRRVATLPPRPVTPLPRKPRPAFPQAATSTLPPPPYPPLPPPPALSQPMPPPPATVEPDGEPVVRPPMPLH
jgi:hypothetical protein